MRKSLHFLSATSRLLNTQTGIVSQRILQFFEISDLRIVTKICVGAQINGDYCRLMWGARRIRKKSYAKVFRASVRAETSRLPVCGSAARRNRRLG
ncbi:hypothetical protein EA213_25830 [Escherichia coli]|nr:hypothetical protein EA213_25830 [Escherichia coli]